MLSKCHNQSYVFEKLSKKKQQNWLDNEDAVKWISFYVIYFHKICIRNDSSKTYLLWFLYVYVFTWMLNIFDIRGSPYKVVVLIWFLLDTCDILAADPIA